MSNYRIFETNEFSKKLKKVSQNEVAFIRAKLTSFVYPQLREEPHYGNNIKKLVDYSPETWRYRIGKYRIFYAIEESEKTVYLLSIDLRKNAY